MNKNKNEFTYDYPPYADPILKIQGVYFFEWFLIVAILVLPALALGWKAFIFGAMGAILIFSLCVRSEERRLNLWNQLISFFSFAIGQKVILKKEREDIDEAPQQNKEKHKKNRKKKPTKKEKKQKKNKEKSMQEYFPFRSIQDNYIEMENGTYYLFLRISSNNLNFLSYSEIYDIMSDLGKEFDKVIIKPSFFIQDSVFDIKKNVKLANKFANEAKTPFVRLLAENIASIIANNKKSAAKKASYFRIEITPNTQKKYSLNEIKSKVKDVFNNTLNLHDTSVLELKQLLAIYGNKLFTTNLPDTEIEYEKEEEITLITKKKEKYEQTQLPGIYELKDMITPITTVFRPSDATIGSYLVKTYAVSSYLASTEDTNILSKIASIKGITTSITIEELSLKKYKSNLKLSIHASNSTSGDEIDEIDSNLSKDSMKQSYRSVRKTKQNMYYVSVLFQLSAKTKDDFSILENHFLEACSDVGISVDPLQTMQKKAWESVNPIGKNKITKWVKQNIPSQSLANLYPFEDTTVMDPEGFPIGTITDKEDLVLFDPLAERDTNHNILILGISGIGKTVLLWLLLQNEIIKGSFVRNIDIEGTCLKFTERLGGININMAGNNQYCINPLQIRIPDEIKAGLVDDYISEVKNFMSIYKSGWSERLLDLFEYYLTLVYRKKGITNETDLSKLKEDDFPLFEDIYKIIEEDKNNFDPDNTLATKTDLNELLLGMQSMVYGADAKLFNRYTYLGTNDMDTLQFMNFDLSDMSTSSKDRKLAQWSNVFTYISQFVNDNMDRKKKIVVSIDEAHDFLKKQYLPIVDIINDYERRFRKYLTSFIKASQTIDEFNTEDTELKDKVKPLFNQPGVKFLFHLGDIDYTIPKDLLNLKEAEINILKKKRKGKCLMRIEENVYDLDILMPAWFKEVKADAKSN